MKKKELISTFLKSDMFTKWHWFYYHFNFYNLNSEHPFAKSLIDSILNIEDKINGFANETIKRIASISGKEKHLPHYEQLLQICSEIYIINQATNCIDHSVTFDYEPTSGDSKKNPEIIMNYAKFSIGIEVKQPSLIGHINKRASNPVQLSTRTPFPIKSFEEIYNTKGITLPRDNPVKDFLISANSKFEEFKKKENFFSILFIVWDDFIYEPISALLGEPSGLFKENSFAKDKSGKRLKFEFVDAVFIDRNLSNIIKGTRDEPLWDNKKNVMDYGKKTEFPFKVIIRNPDSNFSDKIPEEVLQCFQTYELSPYLGAEYIPSDLIHWMDT